MSYTRVRKPPGGDSSFNIFGVPNEPTPSKKTDVSQKAAEEKIAEPAKSEEPVVKEEETSPQPVSSEEPVAKEETAEAKEEEEEEKEKEESPKDETATSTDTKEPEPAPSAATDNKSIQQDVKNKQRGGYNPITGQSYGNSEKPESQSTSTRVRQPPGGASSKLW